MLLRKSDFYAPALLDDQYTRMPPKQRVRSETLKERLLAIHPDTNHITMINIRYSS